MFKIKKIDTELDTAELVGTETDGKTKHDFNLFPCPLKFARRIHNYEITLNEAIDDQEKLENLIIRLETTNQGTHTQKKRKIKSLNLQENYCMREMILLMLSTKKCFRIKIGNLKQKKRNQKKNQEKKNRKKNLKSTLIILSLLLKKNQKA